MGLSYKGVIVQSFEFFLLVGIFIFGTASTVVYYFARYYFGNSTEVLEEKPQEKVVVESPEPQKEIKAAEIAVTKAASKKTLSEALGGTRNQFFKKISGGFISGQKLSEDQLETIEEALYESDIGPRTIGRLIESVSSKETTSVDGLLSSLRSETEDIFRAVQPDADLIELAKNKKPFICLVVGVNGAGKTTSLGKVAYQLKSQGLKVLLVAGDRFRAAAESQLKVWGERSGVEVFDPQGVTDPGAVCFDACQMAVAKNYDVVLIDTAGRLSNQDHLMEELKKVKRVIQKVIPEAPHETLIVVDASTGQNAFRQAEVFNKSLDLTGLLLTKLDGSSKGGVAISLASELKLPIYRVGIGEAIEDLMAFDHKEFAKSLFEMP